MKLVKLLLFLFIGSTLFAQKNWSTHNFEAENKRDVKIKSSSAKSIKSNKSFVARYEIGQALFMKNSESSATKAVFSKAGLGGLNNEDYQKMVNELYEEFEKELKNNGLNITSGEDIIATKTAQKYVSKNKDYFLIGNIRNNTITEGKKKISEGSMPGYPVWAVIRDVKFQPTNKFVYYTDNIIQSGLFNQNLTTKENVNLITAKFFVTFASFDGGKGYKKIKLSTKPNLAVGIQFTIMTPGGATAYVTYKKLPVWAGSEWSEGISETKDNEDLSEFLGLARSAEYTVIANSEKYMSELKSIIMALQKDAIKGIKNAI